MTRKTQVKQNLRKFPSLFNQAQSNPRFPHPQPSPPFAQLQPNPSFSPPIPADDPAVISMSTMYPIRTSRTCHTGEDNALGPERRRPMHSYDTYCARNWGSRQLRTAYRRTGKSRESDELMECSRTVMGKAWWNWWGPAVITVYTRQSPHDFTHRLGSLPLSQSGSGCKQGY